MSCRAVSSGAAVVVIDLGGPWLCDGQARPPVAVELLDADGRCLPCM
jgi:hypothetical protein